MTLISETVKLEEIVVKIKRCAKVLKGGKRLSFNALVAVGDRQGTCGYGYGKAREVPFAVKKAIKAARKNLITIPLKEHTIPHQTFAKYGSSQVIIRPASRGTGIIAGATMRALLELAGVKDVLGKVLGSSNPTNVIKATFLALKQLRSKSTIEKLREVKTEV